MWFQKKKRPGSITFYCFDEEIIRNNEGIFNMSTNTSSVKKEKRERGRKR